jgi:hypothetical protein
MSTSRRNFLSLFGLAGAAASVPAVTAATIASYGGANPPLAPVVVTLRRDKMVPLTANEVDDNFVRIVKRLEEYERRHP